MSKIWGIGDPRFDPRLMDRPEPDEALSPACCEAGVEEERNEADDA